MRTTILPSNPLTFFIILPCRLYIHVSIITCMNTSGFDGHPIATIPCVKAWIKYLSGTRYVIEMVPFDATNIYPTVDDDLAYDCRIE